MSVLLCHHHSDDTAEAPQKLELEDVTMTFRTSQHIVYENVIKLLKRGFVLVFFFPFFRVPEEREGPMGPQDHQEPG